MRLVHISDFHLRMMDKSYEAIDPLFHDLKSLHNKEKIELVVFSGDLIDKGGISFSDPSDGFLSFEEQVIDRIHNELDLGYDKFIICPGNHDISRNLDTVIDENGVKSSLKSINDVKIFQDDKTDFDYIKRIYPYKEFEESLYDKYSKVEITKFETNHEITIDDKEINVLSLNTAWRCYDSEKDKGQIILGEDQILKHASRFDEADLNIAVMHHSFEELIEFEKKIVRDLLNKHFDLVLTGHVHEEDVVAFQDTLGTTIYSTASSNSTLNSSFDNNFVNSYNLIDIYDGRTVITSRKYSNRKRKFVPNVDLPGSDDSGSLYFKKGSTEEVETKKTIEQALQNISEIYEEKANQFLLSFSTDSLAPKDINSLFVMPRILEKQDSKEKDDIELAEKLEKEFSLEEICNESENILLKGRKESGKTILLYKLLIKFSENYSKYNKIPILVDYNKISNNNILSIMSEFLRIPVRELRGKILGNKKFVLLIDNFDFQKDNRQANRIDKFTQEYPNVQVVLATTSSYEDTFNLYKTELSFTEGSKILSIEGFRTKEIHGLINNWFVDNDSFKENKISKNTLVSRFNQLNLPSTPLAVSMFLWITEKQQSYSPTNNAQMLENFLEKLLEKGDSDFVYRHDFNYHNKTNLLIHIAYYMYQKKNNEYSLEYEELRAEIVSYIKTMLFSFDVDTILEDFLKKGIFVKNDYKGNVTVKFRFSCFFQFYLMKNINEKPEFKEFILSEDNSLHFVDELDYYSGLNTRDSHLLKIIVEKMLIHFLPLKSELLNSSKDGYDDYFEFTQSFTSRLTDEKIEHITEKVKEAPDRTAERNDKLLNATEKNSHKINRKENDFPPYKVLENYWILAAMILKNSEDIYDPALKKDSLSSIVDCSLVFATLTKIMLVQMKNEIEEEKSQDKDFLERYRFMTKFLPNLHQDVLSKVMGTKKLEVALRDKVDSIIESTETSDLEKFTYTFLYFDMNIDIKDKYSYVQRLLENSQRLYTKDIVFLNLIEEFFDKGISDFEEDKLKELIAGLKSENTNIGRTKGRIISDLTKKKLLANSKEPNNSVEV